MFPARRMETFPSRSTTIPRRIYIASMEQAWAQFTAYLQKNDPQAFAAINPPVTEQQLVEARSVLGDAFHGELERLYRLADGFAPGAFLLMDSYRILPLSEMIDDSLSLTGTRISTDYLAGESRKLKKFALLTLALTEHNNPDVERVSVSVSRGKSSVFLWCLEGGIHDWEEVVDWDESLEEWLTSLIRDFYG